MSRPTCRKTIAKLRLSYVVITSVDRDDLRDGGAQHFVECIQQHARAVAENPDRSAGAGLPRPPGKGVGDLRRRPAGRDEPQPGNRAAPVQGSAPGFGLHALAEAAARTSRLCIRK
jgi:hypothetical protein